MSDPRQDGPADVVIPPMLQIVGDGGVGGGTTIVLQLSKGLAARGVDVTIASQRGSFLLSQAVELGLRTLPLEFGSRWTTGVVALALRAHMRSNGKMVVHAHGARAGLPVALLPSDVALARLYTVHGFHYGGKRVGARHLAMLAERFCMARADATLFVADHDARAAQLDGLVPPHAVTYVIRNGAKQANPPPHGPRYDIAFLGRLHPAKNPLIIPQILRALWPLRPSLHVIGGGELEGALRESLTRFGVADQVTFHGALPHDDALTMLEGARMMLLPSRREGLPLSVIEAMHRGIPVVASASDGTAEVVADGHSGFLVPGQDVTTYADRIVRLLTDDGLRARIGAAALARARTMFSIDTHLAAHMRLYADAGIGVRKAEA